MSLFFLTYFIVFLTLTDCILCISNLTQNIPLHTISWNFLDTTSLIAEINNKIPEDTVITQIDYEADIALDHAEMCYLMNLNKQLFNRMDLQKALFYISKKKIFQSASIRIYENDDHQSLRIHLILTAAWLMEKIIINSPFLHYKSFYQFYTMHVGDYFDPVKHKHDCFSMKKALVNEGYVEGIIDAKIEKNNHTKRITATISIKSGPLYSIAVTYLKLTSEHGDSIRSLSQKLRNIFLDTLTGKPYDKKYIKETTKLMNNFLAKKGFINPTITIKTKIMKYKKQVIIFFIVNLPRQNRLLFFGNSYFSSKALRDSLLESNLAAFSLPASLLAQDIKKQYYEKGFWDISIKTEEKKGCTLFHLIEGSQAKLESIVCNGITQFDRSYIIDTYLKHLAQHAYIDEKKVTDALNDLITWYQEHGFWHMSIIKKEFIKLPEKENRYILHLTIDEQQPTYLDRCTVSHENISLHHVKSEIEKILFTDCLNKNNQTPFSPLLIQKQKSNIRKYMDDHGYFAHTFSPSYTIDHNLVTLDWLITEPTKQKCFGKTAIQTNALYTLTAIQRELACKEHTPWHPLALEKSINNLKELGIFDHLAIESPENGIDQSEVPIIVKAYILTPLELRVRGGFSLFPTSSPCYTTNSNYIFGANFFYKNPFHQGDRIELNTYVTRFDQHAHLQYHVPWCFGRPIRTTINLYAKNYQHPSSSILHQTTTPRGTAIGCALEMHKTSGPFFLSTLTTIQRRKNRDITYYGSIESIFTATSLNDPLFPTQGLYTKIIGKIMTPLDSNRRTQYLISILIEQSFFTPCFFRTIMGIRIRIGHIFHGRELSRIPRKERFYLGGPHSIRSYEQNMAPPLTKQNDFMLVPVGGQSLFNANVELRLPSYGALSGSIFQDIGILSNALFTDTVRDTVALGSGIGIYYATPIGPIYFTLAFKWHNPYPAIKPYAWSVTFGHSF